MHNLLTSANTLPPFGEHLGARGHGRGYNPRMRARTAALLAAAGCSAGSTLCERTGRCVSIEGDGAPVTAVPPLTAVELFQPPVATSDAISSSFGPRWKSSASRDDFHLGIDYPGTEGTPLLAIGDGTVDGVFADGSEMYPNGGNVVIVEHAIPPTEFHGQPAGRIYAIYLHAATISVAVGDEVVAGQSIATMGKTGDTDFVHLHFETRVQTPCSLGYQQSHPDSACLTGFDPHVHPFLFVGSKNEDRVSVAGVPAEHGWAMRYTEYRGDLDLDVIETDLGTLGFGERLGIDVNTLDDFDYGWIHVEPLPFLSSSDDRVFNLTFPDRPSYVELRDIHGHGVRFGAPP